MGPRSALCAEALLRQCQRVPILPDLLECCPSLVGELWPSLRLSGEAATPPRGVSDRCTTSSLLPVLLPEVREVRKLTQISEGAEATDASSLMDGTSLQPPKSAKAGLTETCESMEDIELEQALKGARGCCRLSITVEHGLER
mmetsp:Transcript_102117/g.329250  ORF Transcript_102117/g.329250 Transcript_102117/m.329250 type:complete len:143 (+) Transcript_102117:274-702(+)